jgi:hypothetical protein
VNSRNMVHHRKLLKRKRGAALHRRGVRVLRDDEDLGEYAESDHKRVGHGR